MNNPPAFPQRHDMDSGDPRWTDASDTWGMTLRDYFAAKAMQGCVANPEDERGFPALAEFAYLVADAMLKAREQ